MCSHELSPEAIQQAMPPGFLEFIHMFHGWEEQNCHWLGSLKWCRSTLCWMLRSCHLQLRHLPAAVSVACQVVYILSSPAQAPHGGSMWLNQLPWLLDQLPVHPASSACLDCQYHLDSVAGAMPSLFNQWFKMMLQLVGRVEGHAHEALVSAARE